MLKTASTYKIKKGITALLSILFVGHTNLNYFGTLINFRGATIQYFKTDLTRMPDIGEHIISKKNEISFNCKFHSSCENLTNFQIYNLCKKLAVEDLDYLLDKFQQFCGNSYKLLVEP